MVEGEQMNGRPIEVRRVSGSSKVRCEMLFVAATYPDVSSTLNDYRTGVLTVGDDERFVRQGSSSRSLLTTDACGLMSTHVQRSEVV
jgi:uncharacterized protein DUF4154